MLNRRTFFQSLTAFSWLPFTSRRTNATGIPSDSSTWPKPSDPHYWRWIRQQFPIPADEAYFNTGTLGARPRQVIDAVIQHMRENERTIAHYDYRPEHVEYITGYRKYEDLRTKLGALLNAKGNEIALVQNATVAINQIANGLDLQAGDEVLITNQEHGGAQGGWDLRAKRYGIVVKQIPLADYLRGENPVEQVTEFSLEPGTHGCAKATFLAVQDIGRQLGAQCRFHGSLEYATLDLD